VSDETTVELDDVAATLTNDGIDVLRVTYSDIIGTERSRDVLVADLSRTLGSGAAFCRSVYGTNPQGGEVDIKGGRSQGMPDVIAIPDLSSIRALPWEPGVAHCVADLINPDHTPAEEAPRQVLRNVIDQFAVLDMQPVVGPELEFFVQEHNPANSSAWRRYGDGAGNIYVSGLKGDPDNFLLHTLRHLGEYGLGAVAGNHEFSAGQFEINLWHSTALDAADRAFRFKSAIKELARRAGKQATFMAKPFNDAGGSGFHLHFSTWSEDGQAIFGGDSASEYGLSETALAAIAGILAHAPALAAISNPTINSYKRFGPDTMAPWLIDWGLDNRSAMVRVPPERGKASRLELRLGDATANPYLAVAGMLAAAYLGIRDGLTPPDPLHGYGYDPDKAAQLPSSLEAALDALEADTEFAKLLGQPFVTTFLTYKRDEIRRFAHYVTDWETQEYAYHL
jgi:glutamine synthetase